MPIRFRCVHCNQLLGIARRKAGQSVKCPTCEQKVEVPGFDPEGTGIQGAPPAPPFTAGQDLDSVVEDAPQPPRSPRSLPPPPPPFPPSPHHPSNEGSFMGEKGPRSPFAHSFDLGAPASQESSVLPFSPPSAQQGIVLSPTWATILTVLAILLLALSFSVGLIVGQRL